jgi:hypothetical protein
MMAGMKHTFPYLLILATGCATGLPSGARVGAIAARFRPMTPAALPRPIPPPPPKPPQPGPGAPPLAAAPKPPTYKGGRTELMGLARGLVGKPTIELNGRRYPDDCTGLVAALYAQLGVNLFAEGQPWDNGVTAIYRFAQAHGRTYEGGRPVAGDLVFFQDTYDINKDGRTNDGLTHVGLVDEVGSDGTVTVIHRVNRGVVRYRMNLQWPARRHHPWTGEPINDSLRHGSAASHSRLTGELFAAFATLLPLETRVAQAPAPKPKPKP